MANFDATPKPRGGLGGWKMTEGGYGLIPTVNMLFGRSDFWPIH